MAGADVPDALLLLYADRSDPVARAILDNPGRFEREVIALSLQQLLLEVAGGTTWKWAGRTIDPSRTAVVNRLPSLGSAGVAGQPNSTFQRTQLWIWLSGELQRFAYASSLPTASSVLGGYGSLLDQWLDMPRLVGGLRVPAHRTPWDNAMPNGDVYLVDPWQLYSLGRPISAGPGTNAGLAYARPAGLLVHVSQVGGTYFLANVPPGMATVQQDYITSFANSMARRSASRILETAFFVGNELPVFYATSPVPLVTGALASYPELVIQGLCDDIRRRSRRTA